MDEHTGIIRPRHGIEASTMVMPTAANGLDPARIGGVEIKPVRLDRGRFGAQRTEKSTPMAANFQQPAPATEAEVIQQQVRGKLRPRSIRLARRPNDFVRRWVVVEELVPPI